MVHKRILISFLVISACVFSAEDLRDIWRRGNYSENINAIKSIDEKTMSLEDFNALKERSLNKQYNLDEIEDKFVRDFCVRKIREAPQRIAEMGENESVKYFSRLAEDNTGYIREMAVHQLQYYKIPKVAGIVMNILDIEFATPLEKRGSPDRPARPMHCSEADSVIRQCLRSLTRLAEDKEVRDYLVNYKGPEELMYCREDILYRIRQGKPNESMISEGIGKTSSKWLKMNLIQDAGDIGNPCFIPALEQALTDEFRFRYHGEWLYSVKSTALNALERIKNVEFEFPTNQ